MTLIICPEATCANGTYYTVASGDTCPSIAAAHKTDVQHIEAIDGTHCATPQLQLNETLVICPATVCEGAVRYTVVSGDTCTSIAKAHTTDLAHVQTLNGTACASVVLQIGEPLVICPAGDCVGGSNYFAESLDTCAKVAVKFLTDVAHVEQADGTACPAKLLIGDLLVICPGGSTPTPAPAPPASGNECNPAKTCNVCKACCESFITDGAACDACVKSQCPAPAPTPAATTVCKTSEYCCPDAKACLTPTKTSCAANATACAADDVCCPLTKICVTPGAACVSPCAGTGDYCCPLAKHCVTPTAPGKFCKAGGCAANEVCCPLTFLCVTVGAVCTAPAFMAAAL
jgi:LysM repeat protein